MIEAVAWSAWTADDGPPNADLLAPRQRRRASLLTRIAAHVLADVTDRGGLDRAEVGTVYATSQGEIGVTVELLSMMHEGDGALSPLRFSGSVHNAAAGYLSIATTNRAFSTTITAGADTVAMGLLEAVAVVGRATDDVVLVVAEEPVPNPLQPSPGYDALAGAVVLRAGSGGGRRLDGPQRHTAPMHALLDVPASIAHNPCAPILRLVAALRADEPSRVWLGAGDTNDGGAQWCVDIGGAGS